MIRALLGWGVVFFAVLQVCEPIIHALHFPEWTLTFAVTLLAAGFPVAAVLSWVFDIGPAGIERTDPPSVTAVAPRRAGGHGSGPPPLHCRLVRGDAQPSDARFYRTFLIGRSADCEVRVKEAFVSRQHLKVMFDGARWWLKDLDTASGTFVGDSPVREVPLPDAVEVELGTGGPRFSLTVEHAVRLADVAASPRGETFSSDTQILRRYLDPAQGIQAGKQTLMFQRAFRKVQAQASRRYQLAVAVTLLALLGAGGMILRQASKLDSLRATAEKQSTR